MTTEWQTVPKEPTAKMLDKAINDFAPGWQPMRIRQAADLYRAMLSVAPKPTEEQKKTPITDKIDSLTYLFEVWKGRKIYHNRITGQFSTESGYTSYVLSDCRVAAMNCY